jgi:hypothetical protein
MPQGLQQTLARADITQLETVRESLMPDGLEMAMSHQQLADLLAFLKGSPPPAAQSGSDRSQPTPVTPTPLP